MIRAPIKRISSTLVIMIPLKSTVYWASISKSDSQKPMTRFFQEPNFLVYIFCLTGLIEFLMGHLNLIVYLNWARTTFFLMKNGKQLSHVCSSNVQFLSYSKCSNWRQISRLLSNFGCLFTFCYLDGANSIKTDLHICNLWTGQFVSYKSVV